MGVDKTQSAIEILKYFYSNADREQGVTISELRKKILPRRGGSTVWLRSKLGLSLVKDIVCIYFDLQYIAKAKPITMKDKEFDSYKITDNGKEFVEEYKSTKHLKKFFEYLLFKEVMKPR
jgi:hypothetical protein